jgi:TRAP-type C4-dicarboxylate transport system permease small subunit
MLRFAVLDDQRTLLVIAIPVIIGLEVWRRWLRHRVPRWMYVIAALLEMAVAGGIAYAQWMLSQTVAQLSNDDPANKASNLSHGISRAMTGNAVAIGSALAAVIVLAVATWRARGIPDGGPVARVVSDQNAASSDTSPSTPT